MIDTFEAIGTHWYISAPSVPDQQSSAVKRAIHQRISLYDSHYSRFIKNTIVTKISESAGTYTMPADFTELYSLYQDLYVLTNGCMTPLVGNTLVDLGYDANYSLAPRTNIRKTPEFNDVLRFKPPLLHVKKPVLLDFGAAGKGHLVDIVSEILESFGATPYIVDAGGDMRARGSNAYTIGLENPFNATEAIGTVQLQNLSLCASAGNRRAWDNYTHFINPHTNKSPTNISGVWVTATSTLLADALTTALLFAPINTLQKHYDFAALLLFADGTHQVTSNFIADLFI